ncbi:MAG TPA: tRNA uridine-5-carboxymethylaminomethyl(34) synthesis enzyme MnmG, partial [Thermovirga lienii]|nr:tRNA uridine-5-carboxymethylaminomethyl(34) synthesis enzyme MnmG [Thermovirga lienii]
TWEIINKIVPSDKSLEKEVIDRVSLEIKYDGYIKRQLKQVERMKNMEKVKIPEDMDYDQVPGLLNESRQKLKKIKPQNLAQASRVSGVTPADIQILWIEIEKRRRKRRQEDGDQAVS